MIIFDPCVAEMSSGQYKAVIWGQWDDHIMDWAGCNYRYVVVQGQPHRGFEIDDEVVRWWDHLSQEEQDEQIGRAELMEGTHIGPYSKYPDLGAGLKLKSKAQGVAS